MVAWANGGGRFWIRAAAAATSPAKAKAPAKAPAAKAEPAGDGDELLMKLDLRVGLIEQVKKAEDGDQLYALQAELGAQYREPLRLHAVRRFLQDLGGARHGRCQLCYLQVRRSVAGGALGGAAGPAYS